MPPKAPQADQPHPEVTPPPTRTAAFIRDTIVTEYSTIAPEVVVTPTAQPKKASPVGPVVGGLIGGIAAGVLAALLVWWCIRHRKREHQRAARAFQRRRQRQLQAAQKRNYHSASSSINSATQQLYAPSVEKGGIGLGFDPSVAVAPPPRVYGTKKEYDRFKSERGYGYEPEPAQYGSSDYYVQQGFEQQAMPPLDFSPLPDHLSANPDDYIVGMAVSTDDDVQSTPAAKSPPSSRKSKSPPNSPQDLGSRTSTRGAARAAVAEKAAAALAAPVTSRHRPSRPSPLASAAGDRMSMPEDPFASPQPGNSPPSSNHSSSSSHAYAAAATGQWGMPSGDHPQPASADPRIPSGQYSYDPFAEYHQYVARDDDEVLASPLDQDQTPRREWI